MEDNRKYYQLIYSQKDAILPLFLAGKKKSDMMNFGLHFTSESGNVEVLEKTYNILLRDNDALRIRFKTNLKGIKQYFEDYQYVKVPIIKIESEDKLLAEMEKYNYFDKLFTSGPLCIAHMFTYDNKATILVTIHHAIIDGFSLDVFATSFLDIYYKIVNGTYVDKTDNLGYTYEQFIIENQPIARAKRRAEKIKYYKDKFNANKNIIGLGRPLRPSSTIDSDCFTMSGEEYKQLIIYCHKIRIPIPFFISCMIMKALCHVKNHDDICCYMLNHGRPKANQKKTIGNMVSSCFAFFHNDDSQSYKDYLSSNYLDYLQSVKHSGLSAFEFVNSSLKHSLRKMRCNYFYFIISCLNLGQNITLEGDLRFNMLPYKHQPNPFYCTVQNSENEMNILLTYQTKMVSKEKLQVIKDELSHCFKEVLEENTTS